MVVHFKDQMFSESTVCGKAAVRRYRYTEVPEVSIASQVSTDVRVTTCKACMKTDKFKSRQAELKNVKPGGIVVLTSCSMCHKKTGDLQPFESAIEMYCKPCLFHISMQKKIQQGKRITMWDAVLGWWFRKR